MVRPSNPLPADAFAAAHRGKLMQNLGRAPARRGALSGMAPGAWLTAWAVVLQVGQRAHI